MHVSAILFLASILPNNCLSSRYHSGRTERLEVLSSDSVEDIGSNAETFRRQYMFNTEQKTANRASPIDQHWEKNHSGTHHIHPDATVDGRVAKKLRPHKTQPTENSSEVHSTKNDRKPTKYDGIEESKGIKHDFKENLENKHDLQEKMFYFKAFKTEKNATHGKKTANTNPREKSEKENHEHISKSDKLKIHENTKKTNKEHKITAETKNLHKQESEKNKKGNIDSSDMQRTKEKGLKDGIRESRNGHHRKKRSSDIDKSLNTNEGKTYPGEKDNNENIYVSQEILETSPLDTDTIHNISELNHSSHEENSETKSSLNVKDAEEYLESNLKNDILRKQKSVNESRQKILLSRQKEPEHFSSKTATIVKNDTSVKEGPKTPHSHAHRHHCYETSISMDALFNERHTTSPLNRVGTFTSLPPMDRFVILENDTQFINIKDDELYCKCCEKNLSSISINQSKSDTTLEPTDISYSEETPTPLSKKETPKYFNEKLHSQLNYEHPGELQLQSTNEDFVLESNAKIPHKEEKLSNSGDLTGIRCSIDDQSYQSIKVITEKSQSRSKSFIHNGKPFQEGTKLQDSSKPIGQSLSICPLSDNDSEADSIIKTSSLEEPDKPINKSDESKRSSNKPIGIPVNQNDIQENNKRENKNQEQSITHKSNADNQTNCIKDKGNHKIERKKRLKVFTIPTDFKKSTETNRNIVPESLRNTHCTNERFEQLSFREPEELHYLTHANQEIQTNVSTPDQSKLTNEYRVVPASKDQNEKSSVPKVELNESLHKKFISSKPDFFDSVEMHEKLELGNTETINDRGKEVQLKENDIFNGKNLVKKACNSWTDTRKLSPTKSKTNNIEELLSLSSNSVKIFKSTNISSLKYTKEEVSKTGAMSVPPGKEPIEDQTVKTKVYIQEADSLISDKYISTSELSTDNPLELRTVLSAANDPSALYQKLNFPNHTDPGQDSDRIRLLPEDCNYELHNTNSMNPNEKFKTNAYIMFNMLSPSIHMPDETSETISKKVRIIERISKNAGNVSCKRQILTASQNGPKHRGKNKISANEDGPLTEIKGTMEVNNSVKETADQGFGDKDEHSDQVSKTENPHAQVGCYVIHPDRLESSPRKSSTKVKDKRWWSFKFRDTKKSMKNKNKSTAEMDLHTDSSNVKNIESIESELKSEPYETISGTDLSHQTQNEDERPKTSVNADKDTEISADEEKLQANGNRDNASIIYDIETSNTSNSIALNEVKIKTQDSSIDDIIRPPRTITVTINNTKSDITVVEPSSKDILSDTLVVAQPERKCSQLHFNNKESTFNKSSLTFKDDSILNVEPDVSILQTISEEENCRLKNDYAHLECPASCNSMTDLAICQDPYANMTLKSSNLCLENAYDLSKKSLNDKKSVSTLHRCSKKEIKTNKESSMTEALDEISRNDGKIIRLVSFHSKSSKSSMPYAIIKEVTVAKEIPHRVESENTSCGFKDHHKPLTENLNDAAKRKPSYVQSYDDSCEREVSTDETERSESSNEGLRARTRNSGHTLSRKGRLESNANSTRAKTMESPKESSNTLRENYPNTSELENPTIKWIRDTLEKKKAVTEAIIAKSQIRKSDPRYYSIEAAKVSKRHSKNTCLHTKTFENQKVSKITNPACTENNYIVKQDYRASQDLLENPPETFTQNCPVTNIPSTHTCSKSRLQKSMTQIENELKKGTNTRRNKKTVTFSGIIVTHPTELGDANIKPFSNNKRESEIFYDNRKIKAVNQDIGGALTGQRRKNKNYSDESNDLRLPLYETEVPCSNLTKLKSILAKKVQNVPGDGFKDTHDESDELRPLISETKFTNPNGSHLPKPKGIFASTIQSLPNDDFEDIRFIESSDSKSLISETKVPYLTSLNLTKLKGILAKRVQSLPGDGFNDNSNYELEELRSLISEEDTCLTRSRKSKGIRKVRSLPDDDFQENKHYNSGKRIPYTSTKVPCLTCPHFHGPEDVLTRKIRSYPDDGFEETAKVIEITKKPQSASSESEGTPEDSDDDVHKHKERNLLPDYAKSIWYNIRKKQNHGPSESATEEIERLMKVMPKSDGRELVLGNLIEGKEKPKPIHVPTLKSEEMPVMKLNNSIMRFNSSKDTEKWKIYNTFSQKKSDGDFPPKYENIRDMLKKNMGKPEDKLPIYEENYRGRQLNIDNVLKNNAIKLSNDFSLSRPPSNTNLLKGKLSKRLMNLTTTTKVPDYTVEEQEEREDDYAYYDRYSYLDEIYKDYDEYYEHEFEIAENQSKAKPLDIPGLGKKWQEVKGIPARGARRISSKVKSNETKKIKRDENEENSDLYDDIDYYYYYENPEGKGFPQQHVPNWYEFQQEPSYQQSPLHGQSGPPPHQSKDPVHQTHKTTADHKPTNPPKAIKTPKTNTEEISTIVLRHTEEKVNYPEKEELKMPRKEEVVLTQADDQRAKGNKSRKDADEKDEKKPSSTEKHEKEKEKGASNEKGNTGEKKKPQEGDKEETTRNPGEDKGGQNPKKPKAGEEDGTANPKIVPQTPTTCIPRPGMAKQVWEELRYSIAFWLFFIFLIVVGICMLFCWLRCSSTQKPNAVSYNCGQPSCRPVYNFEYAYSGEEMGMGEGEGEGTTEFSMTESEANDHVSEYMTYRVEVEQPNESVFCSRFKTRPCGRLSKSEKKLKDEDNDITLEKQHGGGDTCQFTVTGPSMDDFTSGHEISDVETVLKQTLESPVPTQIRKLKDNEMLRSYIPIKTFHVSRCLLQVKDDTTVSALSSGSSDSRLDVVRRERRQKAERKKHNHQASKPNRLTMFKTKISSPNNGIVFSGLSRTTNSTDALKVVTEEEPRIRVRLPMGVSQVANASTNTKSFESFFENDRPNNGMCSTGLRRRLRRFRSQTSEEQDKIKPSKLPVPTRLYGKPRSSRRQTVNSNFC